MGTVSSLRMISFFAVHLAPLSNIYFAHLAIPAYFMDGPIIYGEQCWPSERGNHSLPIYAHEILFASEEASTEFRKDKDGNGKHVVTGYGDDPKKLEFRKYFSTIMLCSLSS